LQQNIRKFFPFDIVLPQALTCLFYKRIPHNTMFFFVKILQNIAIQDQHGADFYVMETGLNPQLYLYVSK